MPRHQGGAKAAGDVGLVRVAWMGWMLATTVAGAGVLGQLILAAVHGGVRLPDDPVTAGIALAFLSAVLLFVGLGFGRAAELRRYATAVPLTEPDTVVSAETSARRPVLRRLGLFGAVFTVMTVLMGYVLDQPIMPPTILCLAGMVAARAARTSRWERRHGVVLWARNIPPQADPLTDRRARRLPPLFTTPREVTSPAR